MRDMILHDNGPQTQLLSGVHLFWADARLLSFGILIFADRRPQRDGRPDEHDDDTADQFRHSPASRRPASSASCVRWM